MMEPWAPTLEEHLLKFKKPEILDKVCEDVHLVKLTAYFGEWLSIATHLGLTLTEQDRIENCWPCQRHVQRIEMLKRWKQKFGREATYRCLAEALFNAMRRDVIDHLSDISASFVNVGSTLIQFGVHLKRLYKLSHKVTSQQYPHMSTSAFRELDMCKRPNISRGQGTQAQARNNSVRLKLSGIAKYVQEGHDARNVILIEGGTGSGKTTQSELLCQRWGRHELFTKYKAVILVTLRNENVQRAGSIKELLQTVCFDHDMVESVVDKEIFGEDVLWVLDGWDELPSNLQEEGSIFYDLVSPEMNKHYKNSVIVFSRSTSAGPLRMEISCRYELMGFNPKQLRQWIVLELANMDKERDIRFTVEDWAEENCDTVKHLAEKIQRFQCKDGSILPIHAAIYLHLYCCDSGFGVSNHYELYDNFVCSILLNHLKDKKRTLQSLDDLPDTVKPQFESICKQACDGIISGSVKFDRSQGDEIDTLGLLSDASYIGTGGYYISYEFIHSAIQEFLAAFHIKNMPGDEVLRSALKPIVLSAGSKVTEEHIVHPLNNPLFLVFLFHILTKSRKRSQCQLVSAALEKGQNESILDLSYQTLFPGDCEAVGYFLSCTRIPMQVKLTKCFVNPQCINRLFTQLQTSNASDPGPELDVDLSHMHEDFSVISTEENFELLSRACRCITALNLSWCSVTVNKCHALANFGMSGADSILSTPLLDHNRDISDDGAKAVAIGLSSEKSSLKYLSLNACGISDHGVCHIAESLKKNRTLQKLHLRGNKITDDGVDHLVHMLKVNDSLSELDIFGNSKLTEVAVDRLLSIDGPTYCKHSVTVWLPDALETEIDVASKGSKNPKCELC